MAQALRPSKNDNDIQFFRSRRQRKNKLANKRTQTEFLKCLQRMHFGEGKGEYTFRVVSWKKMWKSDQNFEAMEY